MSNYVTAARWLGVLSLILLPATDLFAVANWGIALGNSHVNINASVYADSGVNGFDPFPHYEDAQMTNLYIPGFVVGPDTFDFGGALNPMGADEDFSTSPVTFTSASSVGIITIDGVGSSTLNINWRANTLNDYQGYEGFTSNSMAVLLAGIRATVDGVAPGTAVKVLYDWDFFATAVPDHETPGMEDPESAGGGASFTDDQGTGPGNLFNTFVAEPGLLTDIDAGAGSYNLLTSNPMSYLDIAVDANSFTTMDAPGDDPMDPFQVDFAGSEFLARLTLTLVQIVPEPSSLSLAMLSLAGLAFARRRHM